MGVSRGAGGARVRERTNPHAASAPQILSNLVMEELGPELKAELGPRLKGKPQERQRQWIQVGPCGAGSGPAARPVLAPAAHAPRRPRRAHCACSLQISDAVYRMVYEQAKERFDEMLAKLQQARPAMEAVIRTDMDQIITSKEHLASKIRGGHLGQPGQKAPGQSGAAASGLAHLGRGLGIASGSVRPRLGLGTGACR